MNEHRNDKTDQQGSQGSVQAGQNVAQGDSGVFADRKVRRRVTGHPVRRFTLCCVGATGFMVLIIRDPFLVHFFYVPIFLILLPILVISVIRVKSWRARSYCLILMAVVMLWPIGLATIVKNSLVTRLMIISGGYNSCKNSGIVWGNNNRLAICGNLDDTWFNYLVETIVVYDTSGEIAKKADQRSSAWNSSLIKINRAYVLSHFVKKGDEASMPPNWGGLFSKNAYAVSPDFRAVHIYGDFYLVNFPVSPEDLSAIL